MNWKKLRVRDQERLRRIRENRTKGTEGNWYKLERTERKWRNREEVKELKGTGVREIGGTERK